MDAFIDIDSNGNCEASNDDHLLEYRHFVHQESVSSVMTQTRFFQIWRYFHLAGNTQSLPREDPGFDKIYCEAIFRHYHGKRSTPVSP